MTRATIHQTDDWIGFVWLDSSGRAATLTAAAAEADSEPERLLPTHLEALDDALVQAAGRLGEVLGGGRRPRADERRDLVDLHRIADRAAVEYADALAVTGLPTELRAGQIIGTAALVGYLARVAVGLAAPEPMRDRLSPPGTGVVAGFGELVEVHPGSPAHGARWVIRTEDGRLLPASLSLLLHDSSGVQKDAALDEHRAALTAATAAGADPAAEPLVVAAAVDWLLHDWLMAHRPDPSSGAVEIPTGRLDDALMIIEAAATSARLRSALDPELLRLPRVG